MQLQPEINTFIFSATLHDVAGFVANHNLCYLLPWKERRVAKGNFVLHNHITISQTISVTSYHHIIFYFSNPKNTHIRSACKNNKRTIKKTLVLWLNEGHNAS